MPATVDPVPIPVLPPTTTTTTTTTNALFSHGIVNPDINEDRFVSHPLRQIPRAISSYALCSHPTLGDDDDDDREAAGGGGEGEGGGGGGGGGGVAARVSSGLGVAPDEVACDHQASHPELDRRESDLDVDLDLELDLGRECKVMRTTSRRRPTLNRSASAAVYLAGSRASVDAGSGSVTTASATTTTRRSGRLSREWGLTLGSRPPGGDLDDDLPQKRGPTRSPSMGVIRSLGPRTHLGAGGRLYRPTSGNVNSRSRVAARSSRRSLSSRGGGGGGGLDCSDGRIFGTAENGEENEEGGSVPDLDRTERVWMGLALGTDGTEREQGEGEGDVPSDADGVSPASGLSPSLWFHRRERPTPSDTQGSRRSLSVSVAGEREDSEMNEHMCELGLS